MRALIVTPLSRARDRRHRWRIQPSDDWGVGEGGGDGSGWGHGVSHRSAFSCDGVGDYEAEVGDGAGWSEVAEESALCLL